MSDRTRTAVGIVVGAAVSIFAITVTWAHFGGSAVGAAPSTQHGCHFRVPTPTIAHGTASFRVSTTCAQSGSQRELDVILVGDDPSYDDTLNRASEVIPAGARRTTVLSRSGWVCDEDPTSGMSEVYLRVRIAIRENGAWHRSPWAVGSPTRGDCH